MPDDLDRNHQPVASASGRGETPPPVAGDSIGRSPEHGLRAGAGGDSPPARDTRPDRATRFIETSRGILAYSELTPLLGERVLRLETAIYRVEFASCPLDERLPAEFHRRICDDLVPNWASRWRTIEIRVGHQAYFHALEAADHSNWQPLMGIWQNRLTRAETLET